MKLSFFYGFFIIFFFFFFLFFKMENSKEYSFEKCEDKILWNIQYQNFKAKHSNKRRF